MSPDPVATLLDARLTAVDLMRIFNLKKAAYYKFQRMGRFDAFELRPRIGRRLYSAKKVQAHLDGEGVAKSAAWSKRSA